MFMSALLDQDFGAGSPEQVYSRRRRLLSVLLSGELNI
jgi:hypothetical protein